MLSAADKHRAAELQQMIETLEPRLAELRVELIGIRERCDHPRLPKRQPGEQYQDFCPDCGFMAYCYML